MTSTLFCLNCDVQLVLDDQQCHEPHFLQELSGLKQQLQTANEQAKQLREDVEALNQKSTDLQADLTQAEQTHDALNQQLEVKLAAHMLCSSADTAVSQSLSH